MPDLKDPTILYAGSVPVAVMCAGKHQISLVERVGLEGALDVERRCPACVPPACEVHGPYGAGQHWCRPCAVEKDAARAARDFATAKKVELAHYAGEILSDGDEWWPYATDVEGDDEHALTATDGTRYLWGTYAEGAALDLTQAVEDALEEHVEDAVECVDWKKVELAQALVVEALKGVTTYRTDTSVAVILPPTPPDDENEDSKVETEIPVEPTLTPARTEIGTMVARRTS